MWRRYSTWTTHRIRFVCCCALCLVQAFGTLSHVTIAPQGVHYLCNISALCTTFYTVSADEGKRGKHVRDTMVCRLCTSFANTVCKQAYGTRQSSVIILCLDVPQTHSARIHALLTNHPWHCHPPLAPCTTAMPFLLAADKKTFAPKGSFSLPWSGGNKFDTCNPTRTTSMDKQVLLSSTVSSNMWLNLEVSD